MTAVAVSVGCLPYFPYLLFLCSCSPKTHAHYTAFPCCVDSSPFFGRILAMPATENNHVQALGNKLSQSRFAQPFDAQAEASQEPYSPDMPSKSVAVSRRGSGMPVSTLKPPAASRRGSVQQLSPAGAAGLLDPDINNDVSTRGVCGLGKAIACQTGTQPKWSPCPHGLLLCKPHCSCAVGPLAKVLSSSSMPRIALVSTRLCGVG